MKQIMQRIKKLIRPNGQLILEILFAITFAAIVVGISGGILFSSFKSNQTASERSIATDLLEETFDGVRAVAFGKWLNLYNPPDNSNPGTPNKGESNLYYITQSSNNTEGYSISDMKDDAVSWGSASIKGVSATSPRNVWIAGENEQIWKWDGEYWSDWSDVSVGSINFNGVATIWFTEAWFVGNNGNVWKYDGTEIVDRSDDSGLNLSEHILAISAPASDNIWIAGNNGVIRQYDGDSWGTPGSPSPPSGTNIRAVSAITDATDGNKPKAIVGGDNGYVQRYNGSSWSSPDTGDWGIHAINGVSMVDKDNFWIAGDNGNVFHYDDSSWTKIPGDGLWGDDDIVYISAFNNDFIFLVSNDADVPGNSNIWRYDGEEWITVDNGNFEGKTLNAGIDEFSTDGWFVGDGGEVWRYAAVEWRVSGDEEDQNVTINDVTYTRNFYIQNVCRDDSSREILGITNGGGTSETCASGSHDPSTLKITASVDWANGSVSSEDYITRWKSVTCIQTQWSDLVDDPDHLGDKVQLCPTNLYKEADSGMNMNNEDRLRLVAASALPLVIAAPTGTLWSAVFDTTMLPAHRPASPPGRGAAFLSIMWLGSFGDASQEQVKFQIAASNCPNGDGDGSDCENSGAWNYIGGTDCNDEDYFIGGPGEVIKLGCEDEFNNKRYFRYKVTLCRHTNCEDIISSSPTVEDIIIRWAP